MGDRTLQTWLIWKYPRSGIIIIHAPRPKEDRSRHPRIFIDVPGLDSVLPAVPAGFAGRTQFMKIFVDADALPNSIKELLFRAAERFKVGMIVVASKTVKISGSDLISLEVVPVGADSADHRIVELVQAGDLVITADIPLADRILAKKAHAIDPRGVEYTQINIKNRLSMRDLLSDLRSGGMFTGGPAPFDKKNRQAFANLLDRFLTRHLG